MSDTVLMAANGVLHDDDWRINDQGRVLLASLGETYRVVIGLDHHDVDRFKVWAQMQNLKGHQEVLPSLLPVAMRGGDERQAQIENLKGRGYAVTFLVDNNPARIADAMHEGVNGLLFAHAKFQRPEFRPDYTHKPRAWDDIVAEINHQTYLATSLPEHPS